MVQLARNYFPQFECDRLKAMRHPEKILPQYLGHLRVDLAYYHSSKAHEGNNRGISNIIDWYYWTRTKHCQREIK